MKSQQSGFTLVEIAIVLVIIGLLLGGILKGQELINSAKVKNLANDFRVIPTYIYAFQDKFKALPGDDAQVTAHVSGATAATTPAGTVGNGVINGHWNSATATDESYLFWQHVRLANLAAGPTDATDATYRPTNAVGGQIGIYPQHVRLITQMEPGELIVTTNGTESVIAVGEGLVAVSGDRVEILTDMAIRAEALDSAKVDEARKRAKARREDKIADESVAAINASVVRSLARLPAHKRPRQS
jgi:ATP synthase F1 epsilon subunit